MGKIWDIGNMRPVSCLLVGLPMKANYATGISISIRFTSRLSKKAEKVDISCYFVYNKGRKVRNSLNIERSYIYGTSKNYF